MAQKQIEISPKELQIPDWYWYCNPSARIVTVMKNIVLRPRARYEEEKHRYIDEEKAFPEFSGLLLADLYHVVCHRSKVCSIRRALVKLHEQSAPTISLK